MYENAIKAWAEKNNFDLVKKDFSSDQVKEDAAPANEVKDFGLGSLEDGTVIYYPGETITTGSPILIGGPEGEALADGSYTLADEGGAFTLVDGAVVEDEAEDEADDAEATEEDSSSDAGMEGFLAAVTPFLKEFSANNGGLKKENSELRERLENLEKAFAKSPAAVPTVPNVEKEFSKDYSGLSAKASAKAKRLDSMINSKYNK